MPVFAAPDGTQLCYHLKGSGSPLVCLPGGPMQDSAYLGDLGRLSDHRRLILLDHRGTGGSATPSDPSSYRCDHLVNDVEALRRHLALERMDLLGHSGGTNLAVLYAVRHPDRIGRLVLITPSTWALDIESTSDDRRELVELRADEPWYPEAAAAFEAVAAGEGREADWEAMTVFTYGHWDETARAHHASQSGHRNDEAADIYGADDAFDSRAIRDALGTFPAPVLIVAGDRDVAAPPRVMASVAGLFPDATLVVQPTAGHYPWLDDPVAFTTTVADFLH